MNKGWNRVGKWYGKVVGKEGHFYHREVIFPHLLKSLEGAESVLDLACGQGVLARQLPKGCVYVGVDAAESLIKQAKQQNRVKHHQFFVGDVTNPLPIKKQDFDAACIILALQDIAEGQKVIAHAAKHLRPGGQLHIVLNHPCFRAPRQTEWGVDEKRKLQYRRLNAYMSEMRIPIKTAPSQKDSPTVHSHHRPLSAYFQWLSQEGFAVSQLDEWCSNKSSTGSKATMENRARREFPLFLCLTAFRLEC